jgi:hypothetical protein
MEASVQRTPRRLPMSIALAVVLVAAGCSQLGAPRTGGAPTPAGATTTVQAPTTPSSSGSTTPPTTTHPPSAPTWRFPLQVSADHRYLVDQDGKPFRVQGDAGWEASVDLTLDGWRSYLDDRRARGFNTVLVQMTNPVKYNASSHAPGAVGAGGALPFLTNTAGGAWDGDPTFAGDHGAHNPAPGHFDASFASPNPAYFAWIDQLLNEANARNMVVVLTVSYFGYDKGAQDGWWRTMTNAANTQAVSFAFGQYLGNRYKNVPNIIWEAGVDMLPPAGSEGEARAYKMLEGIKAAGDTHLWTGHWVHDYLSTDSATFAPSMDIEGVYTHGAYPQRGPTYARSRLGYSQQPAKPAVLLETNYENEHNATAADIRSYMWGAALSTVGGVIFGSAPLWNFPPDWQNHLDTPGAHDMQRLGAFLDSIPWYQLVPSELNGMKKLITGGTGSYTTMAQPGDSEVGGDDWVVSAATPDGKHLVAYVPDAHNGDITVDATALSGTAQARWFDPSSGTSSDAGTVANAGTRAFTPPGKNGAGAKDWVLILEVR